MNLSRPPAPGRRLATAALALVLVTMACHESHGGGTTTTQELEVTGLDVTTSTPSLAHELVVTVALLAASSASDVGLVFLVADAAEVDAGAPEPALEVVDAEGIADVLAGNHEYSLRLDLPEDTLTPGEYYLVALIDPLDGVPETDEDNNSISSEEIAEVGVRITVSGASQALPDLSIDSVVIDDLLVDVDVTADVHAPVGGIADVANGELGFTVAVRATGPDTIANVDLLVQLELSGIGVFTLSLWDEVLESYTQTHRIASLNAGETTTIHLEAIVSAPDRSQLSAILGAQASMLVNCRAAVLVDPFNTIPEFEAGIREDEDGIDNRDFASFTMRVSRGLELRGGPVDELDWDVPFVKTFSNGNVGVALHCGATAEVGANGIHAQAAASMPVTLVGTTVDLLHLDAVGLFNPLHREDNGLVVTLKALNVKLYEQRTKEDEALAPAPLTFARETSASTTFLVGPVPMFARIGARGTVGLEVAASIGSTFALSADPFLDFHAFGEGGVGASYVGWTLGGGIGADIRLIKERFHAGVAAGTSYDSGTSLMTGSITEQVTNQLEGPDGRVFLFVTAEGQLLWKTISERWEYVLASWKPFLKDDTLFNQTQSLEVTIQ